MPFFKSNEEFLAYVSMGAIGVRKVIDHLQRQGRSPVLLERGSNDFKLWKTSRIKGFRVPDILCADTGRRVESRAKTTFEISGSHSPRKEERAWDYGMYDTDYMAVPVCVKSGNRPVDWTAVDLVQYVLIGDLRAAYKTGVAKMTDPKAAAQGSETRLIWPSTTASSSGTVTVVDEDKIQFRSAKSNRVTTVRRSKDGRSLAPLVKAGQQIQAGQVLAAVVPVFQIVADEPRVDRSHYLKDLTSLSPNVLFSAAKALGLFDDPKVVTALQDHIRNADEHIFIRLEAAAGVARAGEAAGWKFIEAELTSATLTHRLEAIIVLAEIAKPQALAILMRVLADEQQNVEIRAGAAWALGEHGNAAALTALVQVFSDSSQSIRTEAARALLKLAPTTKADIVRLFGGTDDQRRPGVAWALSRAGGVSVAELLPQMTTDDARQWAAYVIGTQDRQAYVSQIEELRQRDPEVYFSVTVLWKILTSWAFNIKEYG